MAAAYVSSLSLSTPNLSLPFSSKSSNSLALKTLNFPIQKCTSHPLLSTPIFLNFTSSFITPISNSSNHSRNMWLFKCTSSSEDESPVEAEESEDEVKAEESEDEVKAEESEDEVKASGNDDESNSLPSMESIISAYKEAIVAGDEKTVSDIEAVLCAMENQKNELNQKVSALSAEITSGKEKYIRLQADFDNFRKRSDKERLSVRSDAQGEVIESLLPMVDNFERAKQHIKAETENEQKINTSYQGIYKQYVEIMRSLNVSVVPTVGKPFDPSLHEAIAREDSEEYDEGVIMEEFRRGFVLGERLIRPAMVKVSAGPGKQASSASVTENEEADQPTAAAGVDEH